MISRISTPVSEVSEAFMPRKPLYNELDGMFGWWPGGHWPLCGRCLPVPARQHAIRGSLSSGSWNKCLRKPRPLRKSSGFYKGISTISADSSFMLRNRATSFGTLMATGCMEYQDEDGLRQPLSNADATFVQIFPWILQCLSSGRSKIGRAEFGQSSNPLLHLTGDVLLVWHRH